MNVKALIPNTLTAANMLCGLFAALYLFEGNVEGAAWAIIIAGVFDLVDGRVARLLKCSSEFGENFDTLSDFASFGVAPALLIFKVAGADSLAGLLGGAYLLAVAFRLARFGVKSRKVKKGLFEG